jgi:hypothetical protein
VLITEGGVAVGGTRSPETLPPHTLPLEGSGEEGVRVKVGVGSGGDEGKEVAEGTRTVGTAIGEGVKEGEGVGTVADEPKALQADRDRAARIRITLKIGLCFIEW